VLPGLVVIRHSINPIKSRVLHIIQESDLEVYCSYYIHTKDIYHHPLAPSALAPGVVLPTPSLEEEGVGSISMHYLRGGICGIAMHHSTSRLRDKNHLSVYIFNLKIKGVGDN
jgi:hypothetical protein